MWKEAEKKFQKDKYLSPLVSKWGSCAIKIRPQKQYFDDLASSIIGQQLSGKAADAIYNKIKIATKANRAGESKKPSLLSPESILSVPDETLRNAGLSWAKVKYIKDLSQKVVGGEVNLRKLSKLANEEIISELTKIKGIGRWTVEMFLMFTLARPDVFPLNDLGIKKGTVKLVGKDLSKEEMEKFSERWRPFRTVASWYIWRSLENR